MSGVFRKTTIVGITTLLSRVTGLVRDTAYAHAFGAGSMMDAFLIAYKIPNFLRRLFAEGAFSQSFVPVISEYRVKSAGRCARTGERRRRDAGCAAAGDLGVRCGDRAADHLCVRTRLFAAAGQVRHGRRNAALDFPLRLFHLADRAVQRRAEQLRALCGAGVHAGHHERGDDRDDAVDCGRCEQSRPGARDRCVCQRRIAGAVPAAIGGQAASAGLATLAAGDGRRASASAG